MSLQSQDDYSLAHTYCLYYEYVTRFENVRPVDYTQILLLPSLTSGHAGEQHEAHPGQGGGGGGQDVTQAVGGPDGQAAEVPGGLGDEAVVEAGEQHEAQPGQGGGGGGQDVFQDVGGVVHIFTSDQTSGKA